MKNKISFFSDMTICVAGAVILIYLILTYALPATLPIIFGWLFSLIIRPLSDKISKWSGAKAKFVRAFLCIFFTLVFFSLIILSLRRLFLELSEFLEKIGDNPKTLEELLFNASESLRENKIFGGVSKIISSLGEYASFADKLLEEGARSLFSFVSSHLSRMAEGAILGLPTAFLFIITFILSSYYFSVDGEKISTFFSSLIPDGARDILKRTKNHLFSSFSAYLRASVILLFLTFIEVLLGLFILRVKYPLVIALIVATIDFLPILGAGIILIPWAIYCLATKSTFLGIGLILLFVAVTVIRQMLEPKIMAKKMGAHPLCIIGSAYVGFKLFGGWGLILAPVICASVAPMLHKTPNMCINTQKRD